MKSITLGFDLGDIKNTVCVLNSRGEIVKETTIANTKKGFKQILNKYKNTKIRAVIETGTHSPWISRLLEERGCEVLIGNSRKLRMIWDNDQKGDEEDAEMLARIGRFDPKLLKPIKHRSEQCHADLTLIKSRDALIDVRTKMINTVRSMVKVFGERLPKCSTAAFHNKMKPHIPNNLKDALLPIIEIIAQLNSKIKDFDKSIAKLCKEKYPETANLRQVNGVGPVTALAFVLTLESPDRFKKSRNVGAFLGLVPKRDQSGMVDKQLRITKAGNKYMRKLLVNCSHYILGVFGKDCDLWRHGKKLMQRGGKNAEKRATIAVARKLAVILHKLWKTEDEYDPFYNLRNKKNKLGKVA